MKTKTVLWLFIIASNIVLAQVDTTSVPFIAYWHQGETHQYRITKIEQSWKEDKLEKNDSTTYEAKFEITDSTETSYTIKCSFANSLMKDLELSKNTLPELSKYELTEIIYTTTETGEYVGIENWEEISNMAKEIFDTAFETLGDGESRKLKKQLASFTKIYSSKASIEQRLFKELPLLHFPFGYEYDATDTVTYTQELANMFGGDPFIGDTKFYFEHVDFEKKHCTFVQEMTLQQEQVLKAIEGLFKKMKLKDKEFRKAMKTAEFNINDIHRFEYLYEPGLPIFIETVRTSVINIASEKGTKIDLLRIERIDE